MRSRPLLALLAALAGALWAAGPAAALSVTREPAAPGGSQGTIDVEDDSAEPNTVTVTREGDEYVITDTTAQQVRALAGGCGGVLEGQTVRCPADGVVRIFLLERDDRATVAPDVPAIIDGGPGNDVIAGATRMSGGEGDDTLTGTDGADLLIGGLGADTVSGGGGNDVVREDRTDLAPDTLDGGAGDDVLSFEGRSAPVQADLGTGGQTAGSPNEGNVVSGFEALVGGAGPDTLRVGVPLAARGSLAPLVGNRGNDRLTLAGGATGTVRGGDGDDRLTGAGGADVLLGEHGDDRLTGGGGADRLDGGIGRDRLSGGAGRDRLIGGLGRDVLLGGAGADLLAARDQQRDRVDGGAGRDRATTDRIDRVRRVERERAST